MPSTAENLDAAQYAEQTRRFGERAFPGCGRRCRQGSTLRDQLAVTVPPGKVPVTGPYPRPVRFGGSTLECVGMPERGRLSGACRISCLADNGQVSAFPSLLQSRSNAQSRKCGCWKRRVTRGSILTGKTSLADGDADELQALLNWDGIDAGRFGGHRHRTHWFSPSQSLRLSRGSAVCDRDDWWARPIVWALLIARSALVGFTVTATSLSPYSEKPTPSSNGSSEPP
ncbi:hypothetical protein HDC34_001885 [Pseudoclavibacter sp. JAI123]|nr:hypothetical protein [Pseudoclavibacter sp. JAI123]